MARLETPSLRVGLLVAPGSTGTASMSASSAMGTTWFLLRAVWAARVTAGLAA